MVRTRLSIVAVLLALFFCALLGRLALLQLVPAVHREMSRKSSHLAVSFPPPARGRILARDGQVLATNAPSFDIHVVYGDLNPRDRLVAILADVLKAEFGSFAEAETIESKILELAQPQAVAAPPGAPLSTPDEAWIYLVGGIHPRVAKAITRRWWRSHLTKKLEAGTDGVWRPRYRTHFAFRVSEKEPYRDLWFARTRLVRQEIVLARLAGLLAGSAVAGAGYDELVGRVREIRERAERQVARMVARELGPPPNGSADPRAYQRWKNDAEKIRGLYRYHDRQQLLVRDVPLSVVAALEYYPASFPGLKARSRSRRIYPENEVCGSLVGYLGRLGAKEAERLRRAGRRIEDFTAGRDLAHFARQRRSLRSGDDWQGVRGLEKTYDEHLRGLHGARIVQLDPRGHPFRVESEEPAVDGGDLRTTIDLPLQRLLYEELLRCAGGTSASGGNAGSAVVMDASTGALLACVGVPSFDPNRMRDAAYFGESGELEERWGGQTRSWLWDRPTRYPLFPGSTFKIVLAAAALESAAELGFSATATSYACDHKFAHFEIHCSSKYGHGLGRLNLVQALQYSCNNYFFSLGYSLLGSERIETWARRLGFGRAAGIDLPHGEYAGKLHPASELEGVQICHYSIGQVYVEATPLQVARCMSAIATGGRVVLRPYLVQPAAPAEPLGLARRTVDVIADGLWRAAHAAGGTAAKDELGLRPFRVALKTGTAEVRKADEELNNAWLAGYAPAGVRAGRPLEARIVFVVVVEETLGHGAEVCAPVVRKLLEYFAAGDPGAYALDASRYRDAGAGD